MHKKSRLTLIFTALLGCLMLVAGSAMAAEKLNKAQLSADLKGAHLVLSLSGKVRYTTTTLRNPDRLVVDLLDTRNATSLSVLVLQDTPIQKVRSGVRQGKDLRLVFELSAPITVSTQLVAGKQLVIELHEKSVRSHSSGKKQISAKKQSVAVKPQAAAPQYAAAEVTASDSKPAPLHAVKNASEGRRDVVITIDAGHGGHDTGALGAQRAIEKNVTLAIARELARILQNEPGYKPVLTRSNDTFIPLKTRAIIARKAQADLFVSIHADAFTESSARGGSVFALSDRGATSTMAAFLANEANKSDQIGGVSTAGKDDGLVKVLADLSLTSSMDASMQVGGKILSAMGNIGRLHSRRVEQAGFMVLKSPDTPSILVETGFISNSEEAQLLTSASYQQRMAQAIFSGINRYFSQNPPPNTYLAWAKRNRSSQQALAETVSAEAIGHP